MAGLLESLKEFRDRLPLIRQAKYAEQYAEQQFDKGLPGLHNGQSDALRHGLAAALISRDYHPALAQGLGDLREMLGSNPEQERRMDMNSHRIGAMLGAQNRGASDADIAKLILTESALAVPQTTDVADGLTFIPSEDRKRRPK